MSIFQALLKKVELATVKELLGHKSMDMTLRYSHLSQQHKKKAVESLEGVLNGHSAQNGGLCRF